MVTFRRRLAILAVLLGLLSLGEPPAGILGSHGYDGFRWDFQPRSVAFAQGLIPAVFWSVQGGGNHLNRDSRVVVGEYLDENDANESTLFVRKTTGYVTIHVSGGASNQFTAIGTRNDREADGSGVSQVGIGMIAFGSASGGTSYGFSTNDLVGFFSEGPQVQGLILGTGQQAPTGNGFLALGVENQDGSQELRALYRSTYKTLTDATTTTFATLNMATGTLASGRFDWTVYMVASGAHQQRNGTAWYNCYNRVSNTEVCQISNAVNLPNLESGSLTVTFTIDASLASNQIAFRVNADTDATPLLLAVQVAFYPMAGAGTWTLP